MQGRTHRLALDDAPLGDAMGWMGDQRALWERKLDVVERYLAERRS